MDQVQLAITGMIGDHCVTKVSNTLQEIHGVDNVDVSLGSASVAYDNTWVNLPTLVAAIERQGYNVVGNSKELADNESPDRPGGAPPGASPEQRRVDSPKGRRVPTPGGDLSGTP
jgi:copper chaperone CopZ